MNTLVVITGPTGVGKTDTAISIAQALSAEIISADSRQLYRDIPIGTAAPTAQQQAIVPHHFVGTLALDEYYSAAQFESDVMQLLPTLFKRSPYAVMCGGSMLYIDAVCKGIDDIPT
ncbi:MAG: AAA family ATPase, partial [Muribaculaceae bacterium]|nr:AAA family ATPase [Muribaculaceae bacterium]